MDPRNLYTLRYREGFGVTQTLIVASNQHMADAVGKKWCNSRINCRFIKTEPAVSADETILNERDIAEVTPKAREKKVTEPAGESVNVPVPPAAVTNAAGRAAAMAANPGTAKPVPTKAAS